MNQSIQFTDLEVWDPIRNAVTCTALVNGFLVNCVVSTQSLDKLYGSTNEDPERYLSLFRLNRWDIEETLEVLIAGQEFDIDGWVNI